MPLIIVLTNQFFNLMAGIMKLRLHVGIPLVLLMVCFSLLSVDTAQAAAMPNYDGDEENFSVAVRNVTGTVTNADDGLPLIGATVLVKGTGTGTVTDIDGNFSIEVTGNDATLVFSYTGYKDLEVAVGTQSTLNVSLSEDTATLDEVVVVGYGIQKKRNVTAAIASLNEEQIKAIPVASGVQAMQGQVAGVDIQSTGGRPGQAPTIRIRGRRSITASNDPLFVIDGIPQTSGSGAIGDINPQDIESMEVLKDAAATAIYGSRGANGVVLITTKRGTESTTTVAYDGYYGVTQVANKVDMMNGEEYTNLAREAFRDGWNGSLPSDNVEIDFDPIELESIATGRSTNWQDLIFQDGWQTNHQLSVRGGDAKTQFNMSLGYYDEQGIITNMDFTRLTGRVNLDHSVSKNVRAGISFLATNSTQNWGSSATLGEALGNVPLGQPYQEDGVTPLFLPTNDGIRTNPLNELVEGAYIDERKVTRIFAPIYLEINLLEGLTYKANFGPDIRNYRRGEFRGSLTNDNRGGPGDAEIQNTQDIGYTVENIVNYNKSFGTRHALNVTLLQSIQKSRFENHYTAVANLPYESQSFYNIGTAQVKGNLASRLSEWSLTSFMGRVNYELDGKYLFQASLRADGSSRLAEGNKWQSFPGLSIGWRLIEEGFMENVGWINDLKLRASYGEVGNTSVDPYQTSGRLSRTVYAFDESPAFGFGLNEIPNPGLGWEVSKTIDVGLDFDLLNGRIAGSIDYYSTETTDILLARNLPPTSGYNSVLQNIGATASTGIELGVTAGIINQNNGLKWDVTVNIASQTEEITELALKDENGNPIDDVGNGWFIGQPIKAWFDYNKIGIYQSNEVDLAATAENKVPGEIKLEDIDGDGVITPADRSIIGSDIPDYFGGITNRFEYKGVDLSIFFYFRQGHTIYSNFHVGNNSLFARYNNLDVDYWTIDNPTNAFPRPNQNQERPRNNTTMGYFDGSYLKLRNVTLGYNLPNDIAEKIGMSRLRVYASGQNLWFTSKFDSFDPEIDTTSDSNLPSLGSGVVPSNRLILFGINANF